MSLKNAQQSILNNAISLLTDYVFLKMMYTNKGEHSSPSPLEMFFTFEDTINQTIKSRQRGWGEDFL